jgi:hypothetical protein
MAGGNHHRNYATQQCRMPYAGFTTRYRSLPPTTGAECGNWLVYLRNLLERGSGPTLEA